MHGRVVQGLVPFRDAQKTGCELEGFRAKAGHVEQLLNAPERAGFFTINNDAFSEPGADAAELCQEVLAGRIEADTHGVDATAERLLERRHQLLLVHIVLVLADTDRLRVDLDELGHGIHEPAAYRNGTAHREVEIGKFFAGDLGGGVDGCAAFVYSIHGDFCLVKNFPRPGQRLFSGCAVTDGYRLDAVALRPGGELLPGPREVGLRRVQKPGVVGQQAALTVEADHLATRAVPGIHGQDNPGAQGRRQQQLPQIG